MAGQERRVEKVKIRDIVPNPFNNIPLEDDAITQLATQFRTRGFHDRLIGRRRKDGKVEIAFGHHRTAALRLVHGYGHEIDIEVADLSDKEMIEEMAGDNDFSFAYTMHKLDKDVRAARDYLIAHPEDQEKTLFSVIDEDKPERVRVGAPMIAKLLHKRKLSQIRLSIERLNAIEDGAVNPEALYLMPNPHVADIFIKVVKKFGRLDKNLHVPFAEKINEQHAYNEHEMGMALALGGLGIYHSEVYDHDYGFNMTFKRLAGSMNQLASQLFYFPSDVNSFFYLDKRVISDVVRPNDLRQFRKNIIILKNTLVQTQEIIESRLPPDFWTQEEAKPPVKQYKALLARTERKQGKRVLLHPGELRKVFGLHKRKGVPWGRYRLWEVKKMIKQGKFYYKPDKKVKQATSPVAPKAKQKKSRSRSSH